MSYSVKSELAGCKRLPGDFFVTLKTATPGLRMQGLGARFFSPTLHTWISRDPMCSSPKARLAVLSKGLYLFASNDAICRLDALGLFDAAACLKTFGYGSNPGKCCCSGPGCEEKYDPAWKCCCPKTGKTHDKHFPWFFTERLQEKKIRWRGRCFSYGIGEVVGGCTVWCRLRSDLNQQCVAYEILVRLLVAGVTIGLPAGFSDFKVTFKDADVPSDFTGGGNLAFVGVTAGPLDVSHLQMDLGKAMLEETDAIFGIDLSGSAYLGRSVMYNEKNLPCEEWEKPIESLR